MTITIKISAYHLYFLEISSGVTLRFGLTGSNERSIISFYIPLDGDKIVLYRWDGNRDNADMLKIIGVDDI